MFKPGTKIWYNTTRIPKPLECEYIGPLEEAGVKISSHVVRFCQQTNLIVDETELFETKKDAEAIKPKSHQDKIDIVKLLLGSTIAP